MISGLDVIETFHIPPVRIPERGGANGGSGTLRKTPRELTRAIAAVGVDDDRVYSVAALVVDCKLYGGK